MKTLMIILALNFISLSANDTLPNSTEEWLEEIVETDDYNIDGCFW